MIIDIKDYLSDFIWRLQQPYDVENKCSGCPMLYSEKVSYEYDEWEDTCMYDKDIYDIEFCYTPIFLLKLLMPIYKKRFVYKKLHQYDGLIEWMIEQDKNKMLEGR